MNAEIERLRRVNQVLREHIAELEQDLQEAAVLLQERERNIQRLNQQGQPAKARIELSDEMWHVLITQGELLLEDHWFRKGDKRSAITWASEQVYKYAKQEQVS
jgi:chromosome segregation ATPase